MSFDHWILALHVLSAFAFVAGIVLFSVLIVAVRRADTPHATLSMEPVANVGTVATAIGAGGTIVFGLWLAFSVGGYDIWDPWIIAAIALWAVAGDMGGRTGRLYRQGRDKARELEAAGRAEPTAELLALNRTAKGVWFHAITSAALLLILIDMVWKPGA